MSRDGEYISLKKGERREALGQAVVATVFYPVFLLIFLGHSMDFRGFTFLGYFLEYNYGLGRLWKAALGFRVKRELATNLNAYKKRCTYERIRLTRMCTRLLLVGSEWRTP